MNAIPEVQELVMFDGAQLVTDSRVVANTFSKRHGNVLRAYDNLECSDEFRRLNFEPSEYINEQGKTQRSVTMTKNGFVMLAMGFTGPKAMSFKEAYIAAFDAMAEHIANHEQNLWQMYQALMAKENESKVRASFGSHSFTYYHVGRFDQLEEACVVAVGLHPHAGEDQRRSGRGEAPTCPARRRPRSTRSWTRATAAARRHRR